MSTDTPTTEDSTATDQNSDFEFQSEQVSDTDFTAFQSNILFVLRGCAGGRYDGEAPNGAKGLAIKRILETSEWYGEEVNHGRLYPNLDTLVEKGLIAKGELDKRTNHYELTDAGVQVIATELQRKMRSFKGTPTGEGR